METTSPLKRELIDMLERTREEIRTLRARINHLEPKAAAYDNITAILGLLPKQSQGFGEDLLWRIEKRLAELTAIPVDEASTS